VARGQPQQGAVLGRPLPRHTHHDLTRPPRESTQHPPPPTLRRRRRPRSSCTRSCTPTWTWPRRPSPREGLRIKWLFSGAEHRPGLSSACSRISPTLSSPAST
jgi:hypothetical protein